MESKYKDKLVKKYGYEIGLEKYNNWYESICRARKRQYNKKYYIDKYGKKRGLKKLEEFKFKTSGSKLRYIKKYGEIEGLKRYDEFRKKCSIYVGDVSQDGLNRYKNRINVLSFQYFLDKANGNYEIAVLLYKDRQNTSSLNKFIKRYGEIDGEEKYRNVINKKIKNFEGKSKFETNFINELVCKLPLGLELYYNENKYLFFTDKNFRKKYNKKAILCDLYIKNLNLCVEINGDFWHLNPIKYESTYYSKFHNKFAEELWKEDADRIHFLKEKYGVHVIVIWETEIRKNKKNIINFLLETINEHRICKTANKICNDKNQKC